MQKESILITSNFSSETGFAWKFFFRLFNAIAHTLHDRDIGICLSFAEVVEPVKVLDKEIPFEVFTFDPLNITFRGVLTLRSNIKRYNIRYGYFTDFGSWHWLYPLMRLWGMKKIVVHSHISVAAPYAPPPETGVKKLLKTAIQRTRLFTPDAIYACSEFVKQRLVNKSCVPEEKIKVITHGIDVDRFLCPQKSSDEGRPVAIFCVARATRHKGVHVLIDAASLLRDQLGITHFKIEYGGDGPDLDDFKALVERNQLSGLFHFMGELSDTKDPTCKADIVVVPSCWGDAMPLSVLEAMSAGKPIIATDVGGVPEEINDQESGILIKPNDSQALAKELARLINDPSLRLTLGEHARKRAEEKFSEKEFYQAVISSLCEDLAIK